MNGRAPQLTIALPVDRNPEAAAGTFAACRQFLAAGRLLLVMSCDQPAGSPGAAVLAAARSAGLPGVLCVQHATALGDCLHTCHLIGQATAPHMWLVDGPRVLAAEEISAVLDRLDAGPCAVLLPFGHAEPGRRAITARDLLIQRFPFSTQAASTVAATALLHAAFSSRIAFHRQPFFGMLVASPLTAPAELLGLPGMPEPPAADSAGQARAWCDLVLYDPGFTLGERRRLLAAWRRNHPSSFHAMRRLGTAGRIISAMLLPSCLQERRDAG